MECHQNTHHLECTGCSPKEYEPIAIRKAHVNFILILVRQRIMLQSGNFQEAHKYHSQAERN